MGDVPTAVQATKNGAENFLTKPVEMPELRAALDKCLEIELLRKRDLVQQRLDKKFQPHFGGSPAVTTLLEYANVAAANETVILLQGETGTGKGVLARWIHERSERRAEAFVELNCSALRGDLLRSELFGHVKGSFTSSIKDKEGLVEIADGGTLFLDEIGDMDIDVQAQLLKTIEERSFRRIGENRLRHSDFRLICATNRDLLSETEKAAFRKDLYYRICVFPIHLPSLRERHDDICGFAEHFLRGFGYSHFPLGPDVVEVLKGYPWPGNVRELKNMLERATLLSQNKPLTRAHFPGLTVSTHGAPEPDTSLTLAEMERRHIEEVLRQCGGDKNRACKALGISLSALYRRLEKFEKDR
jgi:DNA-binding NtrC family response regulator